MNYYGPGGITLVQFCCTTFSERAKRYGRNESSIPIILLLFVSFRRQPYVQKTFLGYLMPYMLKPRNSHMRKQRLVMVPTKAPLEFENGTNRARKNRPKIGPPITLCI